MDIVVFTSVIFAAFLHAAWNAMVKNHKDKYVSISAIVLGHVPASIIVIFFVPSPSIESIPYIITSAFIHLGYQWFLLSSYRYGDYIKVYPIARGSGPVFATIVLLLFFSVVLTNYEIVGIFVISFGILSLSFQDKFNFESKKTIILALSTGIFIGAYSIVDGFGARLSLSPLSYMGWSFILNAFMFPFFLKFMKKPKIYNKVFTEGKKIFFIGGTISYVVYAIIVWSFTQAPIPLVSALRETSVIMAIIIGTIFLKERFTILKAFSIMIIFFGIVLLKFF